MSPALNGSSALERFERSNAIEIRNGIMFNFYPGQPQMETQPLHCCRPNKIYVLLALVPRHPRTLPTVFWYWLILGAAMAGNKAIVPGAWVELDLSMKPLSGSHIANDQNWKWVKVYERGCESRKAGLVRRPSETILMVRL